MNNSELKELKKLGLIGGVRVAEPLDKGELFKYKPLKEVFLFEGITLGVHLARLEAKIEAQNQEIESLKALVNTLIETINNNQNSTNSAINLIMAELEKGKFL